MLRGEQHPGDGMCEGLLVGAFLCGWWGRRLGHLVVWSLRGLCFLQSCADSGKNVVEGGRSGGLWCWIPAGEVVTRWVLGVLLYGDGGCGVVLRRPPLGVLLQGVEADGVVMFRAVESNEGVETVPGVPRWAGVG